MTIDEGRTLLDSADAVTNWADLSGGASGTLDTEIFIQGSGSVSYYTSNSRNGLLYDAGSAQDWSANHFYIWVNCGLVGLLDTKANGGLTIRFCGATVTDWFEVRVAGSDEWPPSVQGGWTMFVVDIETARTTAVANGWTNGTTPATSAIRYVGVTTVTGGAMPRMVDNTWVDAIWRLPTGSAGITVSGTNGGSPWTWEDVRSASEAGAWGTAKAAAGGGIALNCPVDFGVADTATHNFTDTNAKVLWENQEFVAPTGHYALRVTGGAGGSTTWISGIKSGTVPDASGSQGGIISAASGGPRWDFIVGTDVDTVGLYGLTLEHSRDLNFDQSVIEVISCLLLDGTSALTDNGVFQKNSIVNANTADGVAYIPTDDPSNIRDCEFQFSDGHAIEIQTAGTFDLIGNLFSGYGADDSNDAAVYNNSSGAVTLNISGGGDTPTVRNGASASTTVNNNVTVTFTGLKDSTEVRVLDNTTGDFLAGTEDATDGTVDDRSFSFSLGAGTIVDVAIFNINWILPPNNRIENFTIPTTDTSIPITQVIDRNFVNL